MRIEMTCWSKKRMLRRPICLSILSCLVVLGLIGGAGYALGATALKDGKLALSLPEVVIESPDIERLIAQRVRPVPPKQLGVRMPNIFPQAAMPAFIFW